MPLNLKLIGFVSGLPCGTHLTNNLIPDQIIILHSLSSSPPEHIATRHCRIVIAGRRFSIPCKSRQYFLLLVFFTFKVMGFYKHHPPLIFLFQRQSHMQLVHTEKKKGRTLRSGMVQTKLYQCLRLFFMYSNSYTVNIPKFKLVDLYYVLISLIHKQ